MNTDIQQLSHGKQNYELIEWYVQYGHQLRSDAIAHGFHRVFSTVGHGFLRLRLWISNSQRLQP